MSESTAQTPRQKIILMPVFMGLALPGWLLAVSGILFINFWCWLLWPVGCLAQRYIVRRYFSDSCRIPYPAQLLPDFWRGPDYLLVVGLPEGFLEAIDASIASTGEAMINCPTPRRFLWMSLMEYARQRGGVLDVFEADEVSIVVEEQPPVRAGRSGSGRTVFDGPRETQPEAAEPIELSHSVTEVQPRPRPGKRRISLE